MNDVTRRGFLRHGSLGIALAGAMAAVPGMATVLRTPPPSVSGFGGANAEPLIAHVRDLARGEISLMVGKEEVIHRDRDLAARLYAAARQSH